MNILKREALKWLAVKTILKDQRYAYIMLDEASIAEKLESRGSSSYSTTPRTSLLALSRKVNSDLDLISQMMSQIDKRAQWLGDVPMLCIGHYYPASTIPEYFEYQVWDSGLDTVVTAYEMDGDFARKWVFPRYNTNDVPIPDDTIQQWVGFFGLTKRDYKQFEAEMNGRQIVIKEKSKPEPRLWSFGYYKREGTPILWENKRYVVASPPEWDIDKRSWVHTLIERGEESEVEEEISEEELKARRKILQGNIDVINDSTKSFLKEQGIQNEQDIHTEDKKLYTNDD